MRHLVDFHAFNSSFWRFLACFALFSVGVLIFTELYPLYLLDHGKDVVVIGKAALALNIGTVAGTIPAAFMMQRLGIRLTLIISFAGASLASAARLFDQSFLMLYGGAFVAGFFFAILTVTSVVVITQLTEPGKRARGFSLFFGVSIASGVLGDAMGGELPAWIETIFGNKFFSTPKMVAICVACFISLVSVIPAYQLNFSSFVEVERLTIPTNPKVVRFMVAIMAWSFSVGLFAPFFTAFFSDHLGSSVKAIGLDLTGGQIVAAVGALLAPAMMAKYGVVTGIRIMMLATAVAALSLSQHQHLFSTLFGYMAYMFFQSMSQPAIYTLLMNQVTPSEQAGASTLNSLAGFSATALGAYLGGRSIHSFGYDPVLVICGVCCVLSGILFTVLEKHYDETIVPGRASP